MKGKIKALLVFLTVICLIGMFTACGETESTVESGNGTSQSESVDDTSKDDTSVEESSEAGGSVEDSDEDSVEDSIGDSEEDSVEASDEDSQEDSVEAPVVNTYTVVFVNYDDSELSSEVYDEGETVVEPETPVKPADETYTYEFIGWDKTVTVATENVTYKAQFNPVYIEYTVEFVCNGKVVKSEALHYGDAIVAPTEGLERADTEMYDFEFASWDKEVAETVTENVTYTAVYAETIKDGFSANKTVAGVGDSIVLDASAIGGGANYSLGQQNDDEDDTPSFVNQSYFAIDGDFNMNDYIAFDFTGKNLPEIAFFAKNYNDSMYAEGTTKQGIVVVTGITTWDGQLGSDVNGNGTQINYGFPYMIQDAKNGAFVRDSFAESALGRANLVDNTHYRVIMGFTGGENEITLNWYLYNLDTAEVVEQSSMTTWGFFSGTNEQVGNMKIEDLSGSIVLYGKFGVATTVDKIHGVFEDTTIDAIASGLAGEETYTVTLNDAQGEELAVVENVKFGAKVEIDPSLIPEVEVKEDKYFTYSYVWDKPIARVTADATYTLKLKGTAKPGVSSYNTEVGEKVVLGKGSIGDGANYAIGQNNGGHVNQAYIGIDGDFNLDDYVAFDFTGKNMPEVAFFAKNYNDSMYAEDTSKQGIVVVTGITTWDGQLGSGINGNGTQINYGFPYMIQDATSGGFVKDAFANSALGRANLADDTHYRVIMGFTGSGNAITLNWYLYNLDTNAVVEQSSMTTWGFFTGSNAQVGNMTINDLSGSIVLYGKFGTTCTIDKIHGVYENTTVDGVVSGLINNEKSSVTFKDAEGEVLLQKEVDFGTVAEYEGVIPTPEKTEDALYTYAYGWDKEFGPVYGNVVYTLTLKQTAKPGYGAYNVSVKDEGIVLASGSIGAGANYTQGQNAGGSIDLAYFAFDGEYSFNDYLVLDFTGKNMPEVMFFAKNYDKSMYYSQGKQGVVVASGITLWDGTTGSAQANNTMVGVSGPFGAYFEGAAAPHGGNMLGDFSSQLARANLVDGTKYRVIMGITQSGTTFTLNYLLYNLTTGEVVEEITQTSWAFFTGENAAVNNMTLDDLSGSIVLYGKFGAETTVDAIYSIEQDTTLEDLKTEYAPA